MSRVTVDVDPAYDVLVGDRIAGDLAALVADVTPRARHAAIVTEERLAGLPWFAAIDPGIAHSLNLIPDGGEDIKTPATAESLVRAFARTGLSRADLVVAVGGGIVTDIAGYAAATYLRGIDYVNIPTTLLGQVDAGIGGKTGVNLPEGKNLLGAFWQPRAVVCDLSFLSTLHPKELACGRGEIAKYALLDPTPDEVIALTPLEQVKRSVAFKASLVAADERESSDTGDRPYRGRMLLNYGHTLAHAIEAALFEDPRALRHGEAVAVGLRFAAELAHHLGRIDEGRVEVHRRVLSALDLPAEMPAGLDPVTLLSLMRRDKKAEHDLTFVLDGPDGIEPVRGVDADAVLATLVEMGR